MKTYKKFQKYQKYAEMAQSVVNSSTVQNAMNGGKANKPSSNPPAQQHGASGYGQQPAPYGQQQQQYNQQSQPPPATNPGYTYAQAPPPSSTHQYPPSYNGGGAVPSFSNPSAWFDHFDRDRSNSLDREEVVNALCQTFGGDPHRIRDTVYNVWPAFDHDGSGSVDRREFCAPGGMAESLRAAMMLLGGQGQQARQHQMQGGYQPHSGGGMHPQQQQQQQHGQFYHHHQQQQQPSAGGVYLTQQQQAPHGYAGAPYVPHSASSAPTNSSDSTWSCPSCSFINFVEKPSCAACASPRPAGVGNAASRPSVHQPQHHQQWRSAGGNGEDSEPVVVTGTAVGPPTYQPGR